MSKMTAAEIVNIIRAGHDSKVANLQYQGLKVNYLPLEQVSSPEQTELLQTPQPDEKANQQITTDKPDDQLEMELLMVSDPVAYEANLLKEG